jgi:hypothetical protein
MTSTTPTGRLAARLDDAFRRLKLKHPESEAALVDAFNEAFTIAEGEVAAAVARKDSR